jgi:hypothetical protein
MATVSGDSSRSLAVGGWAADAEHDSKSERYLARRLAAAGNDFKGVALITFLLAAAVGTLAWFGAGAAVEHWCVPGGLPRWARWAWLATWLVTLAAAVARWIVPLVRYRVNMVYAARVIEREHPELHNDIVNAVLVKAHPDESAPLVVRSLERRAAKSLAAVPAEGVIDRGPAVRLAAVLAVLVAVACLYQVFGPKSLVKSLARLVAPWSAIVAPSRVQMSPPRLHWRMPGDERATEGDSLDGQRLPFDGTTATLVRGRQLVVAADIRGLRREERPVLQIMPMRDDGSMDPAAAAWEAGMERRGPAAGAGDTFIAVLPDAGRGIDHGLEFVLAAGDARSDPVRIAVVDSPSLLVREIRYDYPPYTGLAPETVAWQGDVRAVEGTRVTVVAESNRPLESAWIEFDGAGRRDRNMKIGASDLARATGSFELHMSADRSRPEHGAYRLMFRPRSADGAKQATLGEPMDHRIEVVADLSPEVSIDDPRESPLRVPAAAPVAVLVRAADPDFGLTRVGLEMRFQNGKPLPGVVLLEKQTAGSFKGMARFVPARLGVGAGAVIEYRAVAADTRPQQPNVAYSPWQVLVVDPSALPQREQPPAGGKRDEERQDDKPPRSGQGEREAGEERGQQDDQGAGDDSSSRDAAAGDRKEGGGQGAADDRPQKGGSRNEKGANEPQGKDEPGEQSGASDGGQGGQQQGKEAGDSGAAGQGANQPSGSGKQREGQSGGEQQGGADQSRGSDSRPSGDGRQDGQGRGQGESGEGGQQQGEGRQGQARNQPGEGNRGGNGSESGEKGGAAKPRDTVAADGTNDGEAMERILEHRQQQQGSDKEGSGKRQNSPECADADGKPCGQEGCSSCGGGGKQGGSSSDGGKSGQDSSASGRQSGGQQSGGQQSGGEQSGGEQSGGQQSGGQQSGGEQSGGEQSGGQQSGGQQSGGQQSGGQQSGGEQSGGEKSGGEKSGGEKSGRGAGGEEQGREGEDAGEADQQRSGPAQRAGGDAAGNAAEKSAGQAEQAGKTPGHAAGGNEPGGQPGPPQPGRPSDQVSPTGRGGSSNGESQAADSDDGSQDPPPSKETEWVEQDVARARNAADLAIEHLRESVAEGRTEVLEQLGWTADQARDFLARWDAMRRMAESDDPRQRGEFERAIRSLGLRPDGVRSSRDVPADVRGGQTEGRRGRPPSEYRDQVKAYLQGAATE